MGAWGPGVFEDDAALDWMGALESSATIIPVVNALRATNSADYLDSRACSEALAAAEVLAALSGRGSATLPKAAAAWVGAHPLQVNDELLQLAQTSVRRIKAKSELRDLWEDSGTLAEWESELTNLENRLADAPGWSKRGSGMTKQEGA